jgi:hypothetical protein
LGQLHRDRDIPVYRHAKRPQWGLAVLSWEGEDKRKFLFADGETRTIKLEYCGLMKEIGKVPDKEQDVVKGLLAKVGDDAPIASTAAPEIEEVVGEGQRTPTFDEQVRWFRTEYPDGFEDPDWEDEVRGMAAPADGPSLDRAIKAALETLERNRVKGADAKAIRAAGAAVLDLVEWTNSDDVAAIVKKRGKTVAPFGRALDDLLHGTGSYAGRFDAWVSACKDLLGHNPSWEMVTALPALLSPQEHCIVHPDAMSRQARWFDPRLRIPEAPNARIYTRVLELTRMVHGALRKAGQKPQDLFDTCEFVRLSLLAAS